MKNSTELTAIITNASFFWERLDTEKFVIDTDIHNNEQELNSRLNRWCQVVAKGNWNLLRKRLEWEGLNLDTIRPRLVGLRLAANQPLPDWAKTLQQIIQTAIEFTPETESFLPIDPQNPIPFEDILLPKIKVARQKLLAHFGCHQLNRDCFPLLLLSEEAYCSLERNLLRQLADLCTKTLDLEFSLVRPFGQNLISLLGVETESDRSKIHYTQFVNKLLKDGLLIFFQKYPVLARLVATAVNLWVESTARFLQRLKQDRMDIQQTFSSTVATSCSHKKESNTEPGYLLSKITSIEASLSDPHNCGQTVMLLTFESGLKLVYKPKDLGLEVVLNQFLSWCNQHSHLLDFKIIQVLNRDNYGWVEYVEHQPCQDETAAKRFYQRAGMLLCVLYVLRGTDCHNENLIASGEHLVLIDMEALLYHQANPLEDSFDVQEFETTAVQQLNNSVLRTGLLPRWDFSGDRRVAYDVSGLGSTDPQQAARKVPCWQLTNTDDMHQRYEAIVLPMEKNVPFLGDIPLSANDYQTEIVEGFEQMYHFLMMHKSLLLAPHSPLAAMQDRQVRFIFRPTRIYNFILQKAWTPECLKHGLDYSIELDRLSYVFLVCQEKPKAWPILNAELRALERLDIPLFTASAASNELWIGTHQVIPHHFKQPSYQQALEQLEALNETDLAWQVGMIQSSFHAKVAQTLTGKSDKWEAESLSLLSSEQLLEEVKRIAAELESRAVGDPNGSVNWIGLSYVPEAERYQLQVLNDSLYEGRCGVSLFLAALYKVTGESQFRDLALQALLSLRRWVKNLDPKSQQPSDRFIGIGAAIGLSSIVYTFVKVSQFLDDVTLLEDAQALADLITPEQIAADTHLDIITGSAGAILGMLSLYKATGTKKVLTKAILCGQHLLSQQISYKGAPKAWQTSGEQPLTGFSHGAAGIAYALLRLYAVTEDRNYYKAGLEGIEYERSVFSESNANWPDLRQLEPLQPSFLVQWCHGAAGIGLGRLGCLGIVEISNVEREIEIALQTTQNYGLQTIDHLCCGNLGRVEVLLVGAQRCQRSDWHRIALENATNIVARARHNGGAYQLFPNLPSSVFHPGFFQGGAGIGYELLRLAVHDLPSVLLWE